MSAVEWQEVQDLADGEQGGEGGTREREPRIGHGDISRKR